MLYETYVVRMDLKRDINRLFIMVAEKIIKADYKRGFSILWLFIRHSSRNDKCACTAFFLL